MGRLALRAVWNSNPNPDQNVDGKPVSVSESVSYMGRLGHMRTIKFRFGREHFIENLSAY